MNLKIREATDSDKISVLKFCKNTFSWGDYVEYVWDFWLSEGHLFLGEHEYPVGICHAFYSHDQIWIEGIRVEPNSRRQNTASKLVKHAEIIGKEKNLSTSYMLIDTENLTSLSMATSLNYEIFQTWNFYSLEPKINLNHNVTFEKSLNQKLYPQYVKSWRWLPIDNETLKSLYSKNQIIKSRLGKNDSVGILNDSEHFDKTLIVTLFSNSDDSVLEILSFLQNFGVKKNYERIQILTKEKLPNFDSLESKISFHLMKKSLI
ncbi:MAG: GNAT family N-acetyltransferase [Nitrosopumilus sp.]|jgi:GNAT superfamily N-acetyltransferase